MDSDHEERDAVEEPSSDSDDSTMNRAKQRMLRNRQRGDALGSPAMARQGRNVITQQAASNFLPEMALQVEHLLPPTKTQPVVKAFQGLKLGKRPPSQPKAVESDSEPESDRDFGTYLVRFTDCFGCSITNLPILYANRRVMMRTSHPSQSN